MPPPASDLDIAPLAGSHGATPDNIAALGIARTKGAAVGVARFGPRIQPPPFPPSDPVAAGSA